MTKAKIGIVTVSDRASAGVYEDISGLAIIDTLNDYLTSEWEPVYQVIPDEQDVIEATLIKMADEDNCSLIVTTGGTGPAKRDVTPEATKAVIEKDLPGMAEAMRAESLKKTPNAVISRAVAGIRKRSIIINLPGSPKAVRENLGVLLRAIPHAVKKLKGDPEDCGKP